jgi:hypothetical protein
MLTREEKQRDERKEKENNARHYAVPSLSHSVNSAIATTTNECTVGNTRSATRIAVNGLRLFLSFSSQSCVVEVHGKDCIACSGRIREG